MLTMTDEEIIALAEKTKKEKYCDKFNNCWECPLFAQYGQISECSDSEYRGSFYKKIFLDGFKEAMIKFQEEIKRLYAQNEKDYEEYNDDNIYGGYTHALEHMETFINS